MKMLMIHADDAGLSHSENRATIQALEMGMVNSYSIMTPCPWFYEIADFAKRNPSYDQGIHLTLTCEWEKYKFGPVSPVAEVPSLVDKNGHFFKNREGVKNNASAEEVRKELKAQIEKALAFGLQPTHLDSHMYSVGARPDLFRIYRELGREYGLPVLISPTLLELAGSVMEDDLNREDLQIEQVYFGAYADFEKGNLKGYYESVLDNLGEGINLLLIHPAFDDNEMKGITVGHPNFGAEWRQIDLDYFTSGECKSKLEANHIKLVTWREIAHLDQTSSKSE